MRISLNYSEIRLKIETKDFFSLVCKIVELHEVTGHDEVKDGKANRKERSQ